MKYIILTLTMICTFSHAEARRMGWNWVKVGTSYQFAEARDMKMNSKGNLLAVGIFRDTIKFETVSAMSPGNDDNFLVAYDQRGNPVSADAFGGSNFSSINETRSLATDNKGNHYLCGTFENVLTLGSSQYDSWSIGVTYVFLAKFNDRNQVQWVHILGSPDDDELPPVVAVDSVGGVYLAGGLGPDAILDEEDTRLTTKGKLDGFLAKFDANTGSRLWIKSWGGQEKDEAVSIAVSPDGQHIVVGSYFTQWADVFGSRINSYGNVANFLILKFNGLGNLAWMKHGGHTGNDYNIHVGLGNDNTVFFAAEAKTLMTIDNVSVSANGEFGKDILLGSVNPAGKLQWMVTHGDVSDEVPRCMHIDRLNNIVVGGYYSGAAKFGGIVLDSAVGRDAFVGRFFGTDGRPDWFRRAGGPYDDEINGLVVTPKGDLFVVGTFDTWIDFFGDRYEGRRFTDVFMASLPCVVVTDFSQTPASDTICTGTLDAIVVRGGYAAYEWSLNGAPYPEVNSNRFQMSRLNRGTYTIQVTINDAYGCVDTTAEVTVTIVGPDKPIIARTDMVLSTSTEYVSYQWHMNGAQVPGANSATYVAPGDGRYYVVVWDSLGCSNVSDTIRIDGTSVNEVLAGRTALRPQPVNDRLFMDFANVPVQKIEIVGALGEIVRTILNPAPTVEISVSDIAPGLWMAVIHTGNAVYAVPFIKD